MKNKMVAFIIVLFVGVIFVIVSNLGLNSMPDKDEMIKITGKITDIERDGYGDDETHEVYVEYEIDNQLYEDRLSYYSSTFRVGQDITLYYEEGNPTKVYAEGEEGFLKIFKVIGIAVSAFGILGMAYTVGKEKGIF